MLFTVYQQKHPNNIGTTEQVWVANLEQLGEVEAIDTSDAIAKAYTWPQFRRAKHLAMFPVVSPK